MFRTLSRALPRQAVLRNKALCRRGVFSGQQQTATGRKTAAAMAIGFLGGFAVYQLVSATEVYAESPALSAEEKKARLSSQHVQVRTSLENPGVYAWGSNVGRVVAPDSTEDIIKSPRRMPFFNNVVLRDLKLGRDIGVGVNEKGDLLQWGNGYSPGIKEPEITLQGKNIARIEISEDRVFALSKDSKVYSLPMSKKDQLEGYKPTESSLIPGLSSQSPIAYRMLEPQLSYFESISSIASGRDHILLLTSQGRVFSAAASSTYPNKGQTGISGLTYATRPPGPYDTCHELTTLGNSKIKQIAAGDYHSLVSDDRGRVFSFGDNTNGQLGFSYDPESNIVPVPTLVPFDSLYSEKDTPKVTRLAAGGLNSYFMVDAEDTQTGRVSADVFACGTGIWGNLGNGRWTHVQGVPTKIKTLSGLSEYCEKTNKVIPIRLSALSVGATHTAAIMNNVTNVDASAASETDFNYGTDVLWWGNNEFYQIGTGKRNNTCVPVYIPPLDPVSPDLITDKSGMTGSASRVDVARESGIIGSESDKVGGGRGTKKDQVHRFQITPRKKVKVQGRNADIEQRIVCGRGNTAVYSGVLS